VPEREVYPQGVPCWVDTQQPDPAAAVEFYRSLFGWDFEDAMPADSPMRYFTARIRGGEVAAVGSVPEGMPPMAMWNTYIAVDSAEDAAAKVKAAGGQVYQEPFDVMEAGRMAVVADPEGAVFCLWEAKRSIGAKVVNEAGALNFNTLNTRDVASAKAFYGSVFGWDTLDVDGADMWTLPGYGDHLEERTPGLRKMVTDMGAVPGFVDVVAAIMPLPTDQPDTPPHWSVTFGTDDADATAAKVAELGGRVIVPPFDAPWVRTTVVADPQGATFVASQFKPENKDLAAG
jgi:predicted enzyme related to lactoylglutathione lyase